MNFTRTTFETDNRCMAWHTHRDRIDQHEDENTQNQYIAAIAFLSNVLFEIGYLFITVGYGLKECEENRIHLNGLQSSWNGRKWKGAMTIVDSNQYGILTLNTLEKKTQIKSNETEQRLIHKCKICISKIPLAMWWARTNHFRCESFVKKIHLAWKSFICYYILRYAFWCVCKTVISDLVVWILFKNKNRVHVSIAEPAFCDCWSQYCW